MKEGISKEEGELSREIATLSDLTIEELKERWRSNYDNAPPGRCSKKLLVSAIAYRTQERASGGLKPSVLRQLEHAADDACAHRVLQTRPVTKASRDTVLIREWRGQSHQVTILERGVLYRKEHYRSLSQVARVITGTSWSGPLFFGLKKRAREGSSGGTR
jgi:Protein of unknown function (DUF2924)